MENTSPEYLQYVEDLILRSIAKARINLESNKPQEAKQILEQVLRVDPTQAEAHHYLSLCYQHEEKFDKCLESLKKAIELAPDNANLHSSLSLCYLYLGDSNKAIECLEDAIKIQPDYRFYSNLGIQLRHRGELDKANEVFKQALLLANEPQLWCNLGGVYGEKLDLPQAMDCFKKALEINPEFPQAHVDLAWSYHLLGDYDKAWREYEYRFEQFQTMIPFKKAYDENKRLDRTSALNGKKVMIYCEQGFGDCINFFRYVKILKKRGAYVIMHCSPVQKNLFARTGWVDEFYSHDVIVLKDSSELPPHDYHTSMLSLPYLLNEPFPSGEPYLTPPEDKVANFADYGDYFKIGISWAGSIRHPNDARRSCKLKYFKNIHDIEKVKLFSLNIGPHLRKYAFNIEPTNLVEDCDDLRIVTASEHVKDFDDLAAFVSGLDLIITVDTALLHLAGAMGKPVLAAIPYNPDWRWGLEGQKTCWYNSVKLFRQPQQNDWTSVFNAIEEEVRQLV